jgi:hypothetical protein
MAEEMLSYRAFIGHDGGVAGFGSSMDSADNRLSPKVTNLQHDRETFVNLSAWSRA